ncbi:response regulator transcription factor [Arenicella xantha]|uniref:LuxR family two component transcriptional regulator n=1 Tax=Arenicella xantha TaxID=644221 RepID=A0A395JKJ0_9GAMM|nr:response regulator transcription factor [Arenicella xantha]RBP51221.1 LuxR family two component transcriptional regulator [Arenicella xantha]
MTGLKILLVDDHALFRSGLCFLLEDLDQALEIIEAESCRQAMSVCEQTTELVLLDFHLPDCDGTFDALKEIKSTFPATTVVLLSSEDDPAIIRGAIDAGAAGFIPKSSTPNIMIAALQLILAGGIYLPPIAYSDNNADPDRLARSVERVEQVNKNPFFDMDDNLPLDHAQVSKLSKRQFEVLIGAIKGKSNKVIARELDIAEGTVKAHLSMAYKVIDVKNRTEAVYVAAKLKFGL